MPSESQDQEIALVTGGSGGIGWRIVAHLAGKRNWQVLVTTRYPNVVIDRSRLAGLSNKVISLECDVSREEAVMELEGRLKSNRIRLLVNNVSGWFEGSLHSMSLTEISETVGATLTSAMLVTHVVGEAMKERGGGNIIFVGSIVGTDLRPSLNTAFNAAKWGLRGLAKSLRREYFNTGIRVTLLSLGLTQDIDEGQSNKTLMPVQSVLKAIDFAIGMPSEMVVDEIVMTPSGRDY